jgi:lipopolysaccharide transport system permease protein
MVVFTLFLGRVASTPGDGAPYSLFVFAGLIPWTFFATAVASAGQSVIASQNMVTKVYFPRLLIPMGAIGAGLVDLLIAIGLLLALMLAYGVLPGPGTLLAPMIALFLTITALGVGALLAALTVAYRDFRHMVPFLVQTWMFATPSIYLQSSSAVAPRWRPWLPLNPAHGLIDNFRRAVLGQPLDSYSLGVSGLVGLLMLAVGCAYFRRVEREFADII